MDSREDPLQLGIHFYDKDGNEIFLSPEIAALYMTQHPEFGFPLDLIAHINGFISASDNMHEFLDVFGNCNDIFLDKSSFDVMFFFANSMAQKTDIFGNKYLDYSNNRFLIQIF